MPKVAASTLQNKVTQMTCYLTTFRPDKRPAQTVNLVTTSDGSVGDEGAKRRAAQ
jgi:hypothetical protein